MFSHFPAEVETASWPPRPPPSFFLSKKNWTQWHSLQLLGVVMHLILVSSKADTKIKSFRWQFVWECDLRKQEWRTSETGTEGVLVSWPLLCLTVLMLEAFWKVSWMHLRAVCLRDERGRIYPLFSIPHWSKSRILRIAPQALNPPCILGCT